MRRLLVCVLPGIVLVASARAGSVPCTGPFTRELDAILVIDELGPAEGAWRGGWEKARPQLADIDGDGDYDLFVTEEDGKLRFYRNEGTVSSPDFVWVEDDWSGLHQLYFARLADVDADGDHDLLVEAPRFTADVGGVPVDRPGAFLYENVGSPAWPEWRILSSRADGYLADVAGNAIPFVTTTPDLVDLEGDGDPDLLFGDASGSMFLYRNVGTTTSPAFQFETDDYGGLRIRPETCSPERSGPGPDLRHGFMLFNFADVNNDLLPDLFVGDEFIDNLYYVRNVGGSPDPTFVCDTPYFFPDTFRTQYLVATFADLDNDMDVDALVGSGVSSSTGLWFLRNQGTPSAPFFVVEDTDYLPELDGGNHSVPAFADVDGDDDLDLYVGFPSEQRVALYENVDTAESPTFALVDPEFRTLPGQSWASPAWQDLDGDDDPDFLLGVSSGAIRYFRNDGPGPILTEILDDPAFGDFADRTVRQRADAQSIPAFLDVDDDGDVDMLVGYASFAETGSLLLFRNDGTPTAPAFVFAGSDFQGLGLVNARLAPAVGDVDGDGALDLLVGTAEGGVEFLRNTASSGAPVFEWVPDYSTLDVGLRAVPALADLDGDGDLDLVLGESGGGLNFYRNLGAAAAASAFGLLTPAEGQEVDGREHVPFDWEASLDAESGLEVSRYELRIAPEPDADPSAWKVVVSGSSEAEVQLQSHFRHDEEVWWTVVAGEGCRAAPVPAWRRLVNSAALVGPPGEIDGPLTRPKPVVTFGIRNLYPSPTRSEATLVLTLPAAGRVRVRVHDAAGRLVATIHDGGLPAGVRQLVWNGLTSAGRPAPPGVYLVRAESARGVATRRLVVLH
jgi:uncharacterized protein (DUF2141 family)